ncbi:DUF6493 family protein [Nonomuraea sp. NPDC049709]|uniref:DUF6493 family protein n=1 Tax=Nonomuraea sp. NPDC049709 TaxID=3154736 RepID=UPI0034269A26
MTAWHEIRRLIHAGDADDLIDRLVTLSPADRGFVAAELRGHLPVLRARAEAGRASLWDEDGWEELSLEPWEQWAELTRLAGAGTLGTAAAVAAWVTRRDLLTEHRHLPAAGFGDPAPMVRLLGHRPAAWQADLAVRLAGRLRGPRDPGAPLALALLRHTAAAPPPHDPLVVAWVSGGAAASSDPLMPALVPRLFEAEGVGRALRHERAAPPTGWLKLLGGLDREEILDGCVRRFLRGGTAQDLRFFARLHELLAPTAAEVERRRRDYVRLLPVAPGPVADLALHHLRRLGGHDPAEVTEALEGLLFRAETKLVRAGLTWFDETVRESPALADDLAPALASAFGHESYPVQGRAAQLALKHRRRFGAAGAERIRAALNALPPALEARLVPAFAGVAPVG